MYIKMKKMQQIISVILLIFMFVSTIGTTVMAIEPTSITASSVNSTQITSAGKKIVGILQTVGVVLSVIILIVIGIKYMMGSAEEKAEYKKTFMPYIIGAALIFAASIFAQVAYDFFNGLKPATATNPADKPASHPGQALY